MKANESLINLDPLEKLCQGDRHKQIEYLSLFLKLIPKSMLKLNDLIVQKNRETWLKEVHYMLPQLRFFGIEHFNLVFEREKEKPMNLIEIVDHHEKGLKILKKAIMEVEIIYEKLQTSH